MSLGKTPATEDLFRSSRELCEQWLSEDSIYRILHREAPRLFADEAFADLFAQRGRNSIPPQIVAVVMVLQRIEGLSDREAVDRCRFDLRWKYAAGGLDFDYSSFVHTVLVGMRARLRRSERPDRIFEAVLQVAKEAGLVGRKRVLDSDGRTLPEPQQQAAELLATVLGQDLQQADGQFCIARGVARDRVISTVDPQSRHGHKTSARGFDGYKGHIAVDPDAEIITATDVTAGNVGDAQSAESLLDDMLDSGDTAVASDDEPDDTLAGQADGQPSEQTEAAKREVYADASYGTADVVQRLESAGIEPYVKVQPPSMRDGKFAQDKFDIDLEAGTVRCPAGQVLNLREQKSGGAIAVFGALCAQCPLHDACTSSERGRTIKVHPQHETLHRVRQQQADPGWKDTYRKTRPKVERKLAHMMRRRHGGRRSRVRGRLRVGHDFSLLAAAVNLQRLAVLGVAYLDDSWCPVALPAPAQ